MMGSYEAPELEVVESQDDFTPAPRRRWALEGSQKIVAVKKLLTLLLIVCTCVLCAVSALGDDEAETTGGFTPTGIGVSPVQSPEPDDPPSPEPGPESLSAALCLLRSARSAACIWIMSRNAGTCANDPGTAMVPGFFHARIFPC